MDVVFEMFWELDCVMRSTTSLKHHKYTQGNNGSAV